MKFRLDDRRVRRAIGAFVVVAAVGASGLADRVPFRIGTFRGQWCDGNPVVYSVTSQSAPMQWVGRIQNGSALDRLRITQSDDGSLRIVRFLSGAYEGQTQEITTRPASVRIFDGQSYAQYWAETGSGPSCTGRNADLRMPYDGP